MDFMLEIVACQHGTINPKSMPLTVGVSVLR